MRSTKVYDGFSTCFRQWRAEGTHCKFIHGYGVSIKITFEGELDDRNWVYDFGGFKRSVVQIDGMYLKEWLEWLLDHTTIVAEDDPQMVYFKVMAEQGIIQLRILPAVGAEIFAQYLYQKLNPAILEETNGRVKIASVEFRENERNAAVYSA